MKRFSTVLCILLAACASGAAKKKQATPPTILNATGFAGIPVGATKPQVTAKGFVCRDEHIGDYLILHECRKPMEFAGRPVEGYAQMNSAGNRAEAVGFDVFFSGDSITAAQNQFYKFEAAVQSMLGTQPAVTATPDTYLAMTDFMFPRTVVSCFLYSDDRTKPPRLRCGAEVRTRK